VRSRSFLIVAAVLVLLLVAAGGVYAYDSGRENQIAKGITVGGVDVGGLKTTAAEQRLRTAVLAKLNRPVVATYHGKRFTLTPKQARVGVDIDGSVAQALNRSRSGSIFVRTSRNLRGTSLNEDLDLDISYNRAAIRKLVKRISRKVDKPATDAHVNLEEGDITPRPSEDGLAVRTARLRSQLRRSLLSTDGARTVRVRTKVVKPKVTTAELANKYPSVVIVNRGAFKLTLYKELKPVKTYGIAVGQVGLETPAGLYHIQSKAVNPSWHVPNSAWAGDLAGKVIPPGPDNPIKARWMGIFDGAGIHGTSDIGSLGSAASHGCIRMSIPDVEELYDKVPLQTAVFVQ
jgi:hypothetical protein